MTVNWFMLPLSWLYGLIVWTRNILFDQKILSSKSFPIPVISIGNLTAGGTGKTPHTEYLVGFLNKKYRVAVLSRGYKRKSRGFVLACPAVSVMEIGDEPFQFYHKFPNVCVAVDTCRRRGIKKLLELPDNQRPQVILLDDAFQHRYILPSLSILLTDRERLFSRDFLLPFGRLRESAAGRKRADIILCTKCDQNLLITDYHAIKVSLNPFPFQSLYFTRYKYGHLQAVFTKKKQEKYVDIQQLKEHSYSFILVSGLADPTTMIAYLSDYTTDLHIVQFADHHFFSRKDLVKIETEWNKIKNKRKLIITSEKDAVRLIHHPLIEKEIKRFFYFLPIEVAFNYPDESSFVKKIETHVEHFIKNCLAI